MNNVFVSFEHVTGTVVDWARTNLLIPETAAQLGVAAFLLCLFAILAPRLRRALLVRVDRARSGATRQIMIPLAAIVPWVALLAAFWFAALAMQRTGHGNAVLRLAESLALAWIVIKLSASFVSNGAIARTFTVVAFVVAALNIAGLLGTVTELLDGVAITVGTLRISVLLLIKGILILALFLWIAGWLARIVDNRLRHLPELTPTMRVLISKCVRFTALTVAVVLALGAVGIDLTAFAVFTGAVGVGIGFGLQKIVSNLISGVILLLDRSIKPGDVIEMDGTYGWITNLNARYVSLATRDGKEILIPNEDLITGKVTNWSYSSELIRQRVAIGISYESDLHLAIQAAVEAADSVERVLKEPAPVCLLKEVGDSSVNLELRFWIRDPANGTANVRSAVMLRVWDLYHERGIEFSSPQRELTLRNPDALAEALYAGPDRRRSIG